MPEVQTYGLEINDLTGEYLPDQLMIESFCFRNALGPESGCLGKFQHFKNIVNLLWNNPTLECRKRFVWHRWADWIFQTLCENKYVAVSGAASAGKSDPLALWALVNYIADPTHCKVLVMSTTIAGAKQRIWKTLVEYWQEIPDLPGKFLPSNNLIKGLAYDGVGLSESSGIRLLASEKSKEKDALDKIIGIKAPRTDGTDGEEGRIGCVILLIDEMTGCSESVYTAAKANLSANENFQLVGIANFNDPFDPFGLLCKPRGGWLKITEDHYEWETEDGGKCIILDAERSPRVQEGNEDCNWMLSAAAIKEREDQFGRNSLTYYRMVRGRPSPKGSETSIYDPAELINGHALEKPTWGLNRPVRCAFLDPAFTVGGDAARATLGELGESETGLQTLHIVLQETLKLDVTKTEVPKSYQLKDEYRKFCQRHGVLPKNAGFDSTGGGGPFGDILHAQWSKEILGISNGGHASSRPASPTNKTPASEIYANKCSEIWYGAQAFFRAGQIRGVPDALAKEICSRQNAKDAKGEAARKLMVESKRVYKQRESGSPDSADSFFGLVELCRQRLGFKPIERAARPEKQPPGEPDFPMHLFTRRAPAFTPSFKRVAGRPRLTVARLDYHQ